MALPGRRLVQEAAKGVEDLLRLLGLLTQWNVPSPPAWPSARTGQGVHQSPPRSKQALMLAASRGAQGPHRSEYRQGLLMRQLRKCFWYAVGEVGGNIGRIPRGTFKRGGRGVAWTLKR